LTKHGGWYNDSTKGEKKDTGSNKAVNNREGGGGKIGGPTRALDGQRVAQGTGGLWKEQFLSRNNYKVANNGTQEKGQMGRRRSHDQENHTRTSTSLEGNVINKQRKKEWNRLGRANKPER